jgi:hypothetical protein
MTVPEIADALDGARQHGADKGEPERPRQSVFRDMTLHAIARELRLASGDRPDAEAFGGRRR